MSTTKLDESEATVQNIAGGYHLVTYGTWQVSVLPDGMISLPSLVRPQDVDDFMVAIEAARDVALTQISENDAARAEQIAALEAVTNRSTREERVAEAKRIRSARSNGPRGARKSESKPATTEES